MTETLPQDKVSNANFLQVAMEDKQAGPTPGHRLGDSLVVPT